jgi:hypothetical protein
LPVSQWANLFGRSKNCLARIFSLSKFVLRFARSNKLV